MSDTDPAKKNPLNVRTILLASFSLAIWAQTETNPVSKTNIPATEPISACAGDRVELLQYPTPARAAHLQVTLVATYTITSEGKLKDLQFASTLDPDKSRLFEDVVRTFLQQASFPPGCEKEPKKVTFEFFFAGEPAAEPKSLIEFKAPDKFQISVNPDMNTPSPSADRAVPSEK